MNNDCLPQVQACAATIRPPRRRSPTYPDVVLPPSAAAGERYGRIAANHASAILC